MFPEVEVLHVREGLVGKYIFGGVVLHPKGGDVVCNYMEDNIIG